jgi:uncharacterized protein
MNRLVDAYIESLPETKREIAEAIRELILTTVPDVEEKLSFKIPFYHYFGMFCYLNEVEEGIDIGFCRGKDLVFAWPQLELRNRVMVASVIITSKKEIQTLQLEQLLLAASHWQIEAKQMNVPMVKAKKKKAASKKKRL